MKKYKVTVMGLITYLVTYNLDHMGFQTLKVQKHAFGASLQKI